MSTREYGYGDEDLPRMAPYRPGAAVRLYRADDPRIAVLADPAEPLPDDWANHLDPDPRYPQGRIWLPPCVELDQAEVLAAHLIRWARSAREAVK